MPHIHFGVCGIGLGHASRCSPIILEARRRGFLTSVSTYGDAVEYFARQGIEVARVPGIGYGSDSSGVVSIKLTLLRNIDLPIKIVAQTLMEAHMIGETKADAVLSDTRASTVLAARMTGRPCTVLLNQYRVILPKDQHPHLASFFDDFINAYTIVWSLADKLFIADYPHPLTISRDNLVLRRNDEERAEFIGPVLERLPFHYPKREVLKERLGFNPSEPLVTIIPTGPYPDRARFSDAILPLLPRLREFQILMTGVGVGQTGWRNGRHLLLDWYKDQYELLAASDIIVSRAGQTLAAKALAFNCRLVVTPIPRQTEQESNAASLAEKRVAIILAEGDISADSLGESIKRSLEEIDEEMLERYARLAGQARAIDRVLESLATGLPGHRMDGI